MYTFERKVLGYKFETKGCYSLDVSSESFVQFQMQEPLLGWEIALSQGQSCASLARSQSLTSTEGPQWTELTLQDLTSSGTFAIKNPLSIPSTPPGSQLGSSSHTSSREGAQRGQILMGIASIILLQTSSLHSGDAQEQELGTQQQAAEQKIRGW